MNLRTHENKMTLYYSKNTGRIQTFCTGIQDLNLFGDDTCDYQLIWDYIITDYDEYIIKNKDLFKIDNNTKSVVSLEEFKVRELSNEIEIKETENINKNDLINIITDLYSTLLESGQKQKNEIPEIILKKIK